ncbi:NUDIX domain-containing protein [Promicromonospora sp. MEB111]|uniref:NUDIX domain-containing protein n=1 Tax=Promicromonospora sp. MEB111 TaxID=3040301 RepID=UPI00254A86C2|nr:NUDIX domain-containing protein [Promicromonospora sp. MEB111]
MPNPTVPPADLHRHDGDGWVTCGDHRHWGLFGAAGLLLVRRDVAGAPSAMVLQHRALWSHMGGTWGIPGGALAPGEKPEDGALREAAEEAAIEPAAVHVVGTHVLEHPAWTYTTVVADVAPGHTVEPRAADPESLEVRWVGLDELDGLNLLPAFAHALPRLLAMLG